MYTRGEFEELRFESAKNMASDLKLQKEAVGLLVRADRYNWIHCTNWFGEPVLQLPQDLLALQEIIFKTRPRYIIELGVAWGGILLFYSTLMQVIGGERVIGVDIYMPEDLKKRLFSHGAISDRISLINKSSIEIETVAEIKSIIGDSREVMCICDSHHSHEHVLKELRLYSPLIGKGYYMVCGDTILEYIPEQTHRPRPWGPGNNPKTALDQFLKECNRFEIDQEVGNKLLLTCNPGGYLRCCRD